MTIKASKKSKSKHNPHDYLGICFWPLFFHSHFFFVFTQHDNQYKTALVFAFDLHLKFQISWRVFDVLEKHDALIFPEIGYQYAVSFLYIVNNGDEENITLNLGNFGACCANVIILCTTLASWHFPSSYSFLFNLYFYFWLLPLVPLACPPYFYLLLPKYSYFCSHFFPSPITPPTATETRVYRPRAISTLWRQC